MVVLLAALGGCRERVLPCRSEYDCLDKEICVTGACRSTCNTSVDCQAGESCVSGACQLRSDAAVADAGNRDRPGQEHPGNDRFGADSNGRDSSGRDSTSSDVRHDTGHDSGRDAGVDAGTPSEQFWFAWCQRQVRCAPQWGAMVADVTACRARLDQLMTCEQWYGLTDTSAVPACVTWMGQASCDELYYWNNPDCLRALTGNSTTAHVGQACHDVGCDDGLYCRWSTTSGICPVCTTIPARYQTCGIIDGVYIPCRADDFCTSYDAGTCAGRRNDNETCDSDQQCGSGYCRLGSCASPFRRGQACGADDRCYAYLTCRGGVCTDPGGTGTPCSGYDSCQQTHVCHRGTCAPLDVCVPASVGSACSYAPGCTGGAWCNYDEDIYECSANTPLNGLCTDYRECGANADCIDVSGTRQCIARAGLGGSCSIAYCVTDTYCDYNATPRVCKAFKPNGVDCSTNWECQSYYCNTATNICADEPACTMP